MGAPFGYRRRASRLLGRPSEAGAAELASAALFTGLFLALGAHMTFGPIWLESWGLTTAEIGALNVLAVLVRIAAGATLPALADRWGRPREVAAALGLLGAIAALLHLVVGDRVGLVALTIALAAAFAGLIPLLDAGAHAAAERRGFPYGRARSAGSFAFLFASFMVGALLDAIGLVDAVMVWIAVSMLSVAVCARFAPFETSTARPEPGSDRFWSAARRLLSDGPFRVFLAAMAAVTASHAVFYAYGSVHWRALGFSETAIGALWAWGVLSEIALFAVGRRVMGTLGPARALALAGGAAAVRWVGMMADPGVAGAAALQSLHALTFGLMHLAAMDFVARAAPDGARATAQGLVSAAAGGVGMAIGFAAAAYAYPTFGAAAYGLSAILGLAGLAAAWRLRALER